MVAWGNPGLGGDTSKADGSVVAWGSRAPRGQLQPAEPCQHSMAICDTGPAGCTAFPNSCLHATARPRPRPRPPDRQMKFCGTSNVVEHRILWNIGILWNIDFCGTCSAVEHQILWNIECSGTLKPVEHLLLWNIRINSKMK